MIILKGDHHDHVIEGKYKIIKNYGNGELVIEIEEATITHPEHVPPILLKDCVIYTSRQQEVINGNISYVMD